MLAAVLIAAVCVLIALTAAYSAVEAAFGALARADLDALGEETGSRALRRIVASPAEHVNAVTFARVTVEMMGAVLVTILLARVVHGAVLQFFVAAAIMLVISFVITGSSPRSVGRAHPRTVLRRTTLLVRSARVLIGPLADLIVALGDLVTPGRPARAMSVTSREQLLGLVDEAAETGVVDAEDRELIHSTLEFTDRIVREVMVPRTDMFTIRATTSLAAAIGMLLGSGISRAPVIGRDRDDVVGVLYLKDAVARERRLRTGPQRVPALLGPIEAAAGGVRGIARPAYFVPESIAASSLMRSMQRESRHFAMVIDEYGGIAGLVTLEDLVEELVGEISDEYDRQEPEPQRLDDGVWRVPARLPLNELAQLLGVEIDTDEVDSAAGLLAMALGKIPESGDVAEIGGLRLVAERAGRRRRILTLLVSRSGPDTDHDGEQAREQAEGASQGRGDEGGEDG